MATITCFAVDGGARTRDVADGDSLMAVMAAVPGIDGDCGGTCAGATCPVHDPVGRPAAGAVSAMEMAMLDFAAGVAADSWRMARQIIASPMLDGMVVRAPANQQCCYVVIPAKAGTHLLQTAGDGSPLSRG